MFGLFPYTWSQFEAHINLKFSATLLLWVIFLRVIYLCGLCDSILAGHHVFEASFGHTTSTVSVLGTNFVLVAVSFLLVCMSPSLKKSVAMLNGHLSHEQPLSTDGTRHCLLPSTVTGVVLFATVTALHVLVCYGQFDEKTSVPAKILVVIYQTLMLGSYLPVLFLFDTFIMILGYGLRRATRETTQKMSQELCMRRPVRKNNLSTAEYQNAEDLHQLFELEKEIRKVRLRYSHKYCYMNLVGRNH